jgi:hypothetical protein
MCGLCGVLNHADHWTSGPGRADAPGSPPPAADRQLRALAANDILGLFGLRLDSWAGRYTLRSQTGKMAVVDNLGAIWVEAEKLLGHPCDPLDPRVLARLEAKG